MYLIRLIKIAHFQCTESEFNDFKPRFKSPKNRFQFSAGLNLEKLNTILSETNYLNSASGKTICFKPTSDHTRILKCWPHVL